MSVENKKIVLNLNRNWQPINVRTVKEAFVSMNGGDKDNPPVKALDIVYPLKENGEYDFDSQPSINPVGWGEWLSLPIREYDYVINTSKYKIRIPLVVVSVNYAKIPKKRFRPTKGILYEMQKGVCGLTHKKISMKQANIEHKTPKSFGGRETFENLMVVDKDINSKRGNKPYEELNLQPLFNHKEPQSIPYMVKEAMFLDWKWFIGV